MRSQINAPHFHDEDAARAFVEAHLWPDGPVCPFCGERERIGELKGKTTRPGLRKCYACKKPFTVKIGTVFQESNAPFRYWLQAIYLMCASKKGVSTRQLQRTLGCGMKTAWHLGMRIREMMKRDPDIIFPMGGAGQFIEAEAPALRWNSLKTGHIKSRPLGDSERTIGAGQNRQAILTS